MGVVRRVARARLASQVIRQLRQAGITDAGYDRTTFSVRFQPLGHGAPVVLRLDNLLAELTGSRAARRARISRFVADFVRLPEVPGSWADVCPRLRPVLRGAPMTPPGTPGSPIRRPALPYLAELIVIDQPDTMTYVAAEHVTAWGRSEAEVFAAARDNLSGSVPEPPGEPAAVLRFVDDGDAYWTSYLLIDGWLAGLAELVGGRPVAFAPDRGTLLVTADGAPLATLFPLVEQQYRTAARAISPMAYVSDTRGRTVPYPAPTGHPLHATVQRAQSLLAVHEYAHQARLLAGGTVEPLALHLAGSAEQGWWTRVIWPRDTPALLPVADEVRLGTRVVPWAMVAPRLRPVAGLEPARWYADGWPAVPPL